MVDKNNSTDDKQKFWIKGLPITMTAEYNEFIREAVLNTYKGSL